MRSRARAFSRIPARGPTFADLLGGRLHSQLATVSAAATGVQRAHSQLCPINDLDQFDEIARICCESSTGAADCSGGFPAVCTRECSMIMEPWYSNCGPLIDILGDMWAADEDAMGAFASGPCHHTNVLFEHAAVGSCAPDMLQVWTDDVNAACCMQNGVYQCEAGVPWGCDAECAIEFVPFWENCMLSSGVAGTEDLASFATLYTTCQTLSPSEGLLLMREVNNLINDPWCEINTTSIISIDQANAPCSTDESGFCGRTIESGLYTCEADYCSVRCVVITFFLMFWLLLSPLLFGPCADADLHSSPRLRQFVRSPVRWASRRPSTWRSSWPGDASLRDGQLPNV